VDGDGFDDALVGYRFEGVGPFQGAGVVRLFRGTAVGLSEEAAWSASSEWLATFFGDSLGRAGDVNGDGRDDVVVGARFYDPTLNGTAWGGAWVYLGREGGLEAEEAWMGAGGHALAYYGTCVGGFGDTNGDGFDDVLVTATAYDLLGYRDGQAWVYGGSGP
jgi:hypothetical protein